MLQFLAADLLDLPFPRQCAGCGGPVTGHEQSHLCWDCLSALEVIKPPFCSLCGDPIDGIAEHEFQCSACTDRKPYFDLARSVVRHRGTIRRALHMFKYDNLTCLAADFARMMDICVRTHFPKIDFDFITYVPLYPRKERERSYNQAALLASELARRMDVQCVAGCLSRVRDTPSQTDRTAYQREQNVKSAFRVEKARWIDGRVVLLVDDVMTTGATVSECSKMLKKARAAGVYVVTVVRG